jgi:hypothetical protein
MATILPVVFHSYANWVGVLRTYVGAAAEEFGLYNTIGPDPPLGPAVVMLFVPFG